jgi:hypothetical protein
VDIAIYFKPQGRELEWEEVDKDYTAEDEYHICDCGNLCCCHEPCQLVVVPMNPWLSKIVDSDLQGRQSGGQSVPTVVSSRRQLSGNGASVQRVLLVGIDGSQFLAWRGPVRDDRQHGGKLVDQSGGQSLGRE